MPAAKKMVPCSLVANARLPVDADLILADVQLEHDALRLQEVELALEQLQRR